MLKLRLESVALDGEVVWLTESGVSDFDALQSRRNDARVESSHRDRPAEAPHFISPSIVRLNFQQLRLDTLDRLADIRAEANLTDRELLERGKMLLDDAEQRRQAPRLVLVHLPVEVAGLTLERIGQEVGDTRAAEVHQRVAQSPPSFSEKVTLNCS